jgi:omega-amidase
MAVICCQLNIAWEDKARNCEQVRAMFDGQRLEPNSLILLPEMFATGFSMNTGNIAEASDGPTTQFMRGLARAREAYVLGGMARRDSAGRIQNEAVCIAPSGRCAARYAKLHLFAPGRETEHYTAGRNITLFHWGRWNVAIFICYDLRFPEVFRMAVQRGAELFVVIANWPSLRRSHWSALLRARAVENQAFVIGVNRCGRDPQHDYAGGSVVINPRGETIVSAGSRETILIADLNPSDVFTWRRDFPALEDIRTDFTLKQPRGAL